MCININYKLTPFISLSIENSKDISWICQTFATKIIIYYFLQSTVLHRALLFVDNRKLCKCGYYHSIIESDTCHSNYLRQVQIPHWDFWRRGFVQRISFHHCFLSLHLKNITCLREGFILIQYLKEMLFPQFVCFDVWINDGTYQVQMTYGRFWETFYPHFSVSWLPQCI